MTAHIVWDLAADCFRLVVLRRQKSCLQNCCASDRQRVLERRQNAVVWHGRRRRADSRRPGNPRHCRTRTGRRESQSWTRRAAAHEASPAGGSQARYDRIALCHSRAWRQRSEPTPGSASVRRWCRSTARYSSPDRLPTSGVTGR